MEAIVDVRIAERVPVLSTFWSDPTPYVARAHEAGMKVIHQVGSVAEAQQAARAGVDAIIAQGRSHSRGSRHDRACEEDLYPARDRRFGKVFLRLVGRLMFLCGTFVTLVGPSVTPTATLVSS